MRHTFVQMSSRRRGRRDRAVILSATFAAVWLMTLGVAAQARPLVEDAGGSGRSSARDVSIHEDFSSQQLRAIRESSAEAGSVSNVFDGLDLSGPQLRATRASFPESGSVWDQPGMYAAQIRAAANASSPESGSVWDQPGMYAAQIRALNDPDYGAPVVAPVAEAEDGFDSESLGETVSVTLLAAAMMAAGIWFVTQRRGTQHA